MGVTEYRSWAQLASGDKVGARKGITRALATARTRNLLLLDATCRLTENDAVGARKSAEEVLFKNPEDTAGLYLLVQSYQLQHQMKAAVQAVRRYSVEKPTSAPIHHCLGQVLLGE
jgi:predicted Zn-dependent protease